MRIKIRKTASSNYISRCYRHAAPDCGRLHSPEYAEMLKAVEGQWLEVETAHLFEDQFNTTPIEGVTEYGLGIWIEDVEEIEDDVRQRILKCHYCAGYDNDGNGVCDKCGRSDYLELFIPKVPYGN